MSGLDTRAREHTPVAGSLPPGSMVCSAFFRGLSMPSFDVVSEVDLQEVRNAVDQAQRVIDTRFDFKAVDASFEQNESEITLKAEHEFQLQQMLDILRERLAKRGVDVAAMDVQDAHTSLSQASQKILIKQGIGSDSAKKMVKNIKASKIKVQAQIQGEQLRVTGKKRDDLQKVITLLKEGSYDLPLQFKNFRD